jgi:predicted ribosomally synthesized peptide with SipW-like signal peptide
MDKKKIVGSAITIGATGALLIGATFAYFSTQVTSNDNTFSTGVMELKIRDNNEGFTNAVTASTVATNMVPGGAVTESYVCFRNTGDYDIQEIITSMTASGNVNALAPWVNAVKVELKAVTTADCGNFADGAFTAADDYTSMFVSRYDGEGGEPTDTIVSLKELLNDVDGTDRLEDDLLDGVASVLPANPSFLIKFRTTWQLSASAPNYAQGKSVTVNTTFVGNQDESP